MWGCTSPQWSGTCRSDSPQMQLCSSLRPRRTTQPTTSGTTTISSDWSTPNVRPRLERSMNLGNGDVRSGDLPRSRADQDAPLRIAFVMHEYAGVTHNFTGGLGNWIAALA